MTLGEATAKRIGMYLEQRKITYSKFAREAGIPKSTIENLSNGHTKSPTLAFIYKLAFCLNISPIEFLDCELFSIDSVSFE